MVFWTGPTAASLNDCQTRYLYDPHQQYLSTHPKFKNWNWNLSSFPPYTIGICTWIAYRVLYMWEDALMGYTYEGKAKQKKWVLHLVAKVVSSMVILISCSSGFHSPGTAPEKVLHLLLLINSFNGQWNIAIVRVHSCRGIGLNIRTWTGLCI